MEKLISELFTHPEPSVRYRIEVGVKGFTEQSREVLQFRLAVKNSARVAAMLASRDAEGRFPWHAYQKWKGSFWTLLAISDLGYPLNDEELIPLREQTLDWLFDSRRLKAVPLINNRWRRCACQEGGAVLSLLKLGLADSRVEQLIHMLLKWQWPDGGWNCDIKPDASHSSFNETFIPLRALNAYWLASGDEQVKAARDRAAELLLSHSLFKRVATGETIKPAFITLAYPGCWHYNFLNGLIALAECDLLGDPRCNAALDLLEAKRLPDGGFPAEIKYYQVSDERKTGTTFVDWGGTSRQHYNPFVTAEALSVLKEAGRI
jgi:hypothetical protein